MPSAPPMGRARKTTQWSATTWSSAAGRNAQRAARARARVEHGPVQPAQLGHGPALERRPRDVPGRLGAELDPDLAVLAHAVPVLPADWRGSGRVPLRRVEEAEHDD